MSRRRGTGLPPEWQVHNNRPKRRRSFVRLSRQEKRLGGLAVALVFLSVYTAAGGGIPTLAGQGIARPPYRNCAAARADGHAPIYRGEPGWGEHLDRDGDGKGCEWG